MTEGESDVDFWLFGYGSLIWKPPPHFDKRVPGYIVGYVRRFWQARYVSFRPCEKKYSPNDFPTSEDHRGTPEAPGRVVTLIERSFWETLDDPQHQTESNRVWGAAYHIIPAKVKEVQEYLDIREINGYSIQYTAFHPADPGVGVIRCMVYIGMPDNPQFLGALRPSDVALRINQSHGPSGENREYLLHLEESLTSLGPESGDEHISDLARRVRAMKAPGRGERGEESDKLQLEQVTSTDKQEEIEKDV